jgi:PPOX class probable F420-dependent enzyme
VDDGDLVVSITSERQKFRNLRGNPNCTLFIIDPTNPYRTLEVRAVAEMTADPDKTTVQLLARIYGLDDGALVHPDEDRYRVTLHPRRVVAN